MSSLNEYGIIPHNEQYKSVEQEPQKPIAWMFEFPDKRLAPKFDSVPHGGNWVPLYTTPPQRKPLTDEELAKCWHDTPWNADMKTRVFAFARTIEKAQGGKRDE